MGFSVTTACAQVAPPASTRIPADYFGLHVNNAAPANLIGRPTTPMPDLGQRAIRLQDAYVDWRRLNPSRGVFDWRLLDARVAQDEARGLTTMLVLGSPPDWVKTPWLQSEAPDRADRFLYGPWVDYVTAVANRYGNRIAYYELWNEPDVGGFNGGRLAEMVELARRAQPILKRAAPRARIVSPAFSLPEIEMLGMARHSPPVTLKTFLEAGGGRYVDMVSIHAYPGDGNAPEVLTDRLRYARMLIDKAGLAKLPLIDSESGARGWRDADRKLHNIPPNFGEPLPEAPVDLQSAYVSRTIMVIAASGVIRQSYYFTFDNGDNLQGNRSVMAIVMHGAGQEVRSPGFAYRYLATILPGAKLDPVERSGRHWELGMTTRQGRRIRAYWCDDYQTDQVPVSVGIVRDVTGAVIGDAKGALAINASPVFVEH